MTDNNNPEFGITFVINEIRREIRQIATDLDGGKADTQAIQKELFSLNTRLNVVEKYIAERDLRDKAEETRRWELLMRAGERVFWAVLVALAMFGKDLWQRVYGP